MKLGVTSDLHGNLGKARKFASFFKKSDVDAIVLAGYTPSDKNQRQSLTKILKIFTKTGKKIFILPGSHEQYIPYYAALTKFKKVTDCTKTFIAKLNNQKIVFIPGADSTAPGAGFRILENKKQYLRFKRRVKEMREHFWGKIAPFFVNDFAKYISKGVVVISHVPPEFKTRKAIDVATFGTPKKIFVLLERHKKLSKTTRGSLMIPDHVVFGLEEAKRLIKKGYPVRIITENVGNPWLKKIIRKNKIKFFICSHIHEAGGRANSSKGKTIKQGKWSKELFYNCSGRAGIVEFLNGKARYRNIT